ncbi:hypothetical protein Rhe02_60910 [Rhizocola hellebori]|uniref:Uncharacterized protein n=1 Tax=Rhizocola hellebori TaxID=1392758 RepID=A0A8J3QC25_9ACTN|nr:hypothetical protein [Rhizocola hellebori]GIH08024.1 hypothetical protein Rhe02_60910 [Rhizocola hellebori]
MADDLTPTDYAFLILLDIEREEISNTDLNDHHGVRLVGASCTRLNAGGYVISKTDQRPYRHAISPKGIKVLKVPLEVAGDGEGVEESKLGAKELPFWAALAALHEYHLNDGDKPRTLAPLRDEQSLERQIRGAYADLATEPGAWVSLSRLRPLFDNVSKADLDKALRSLLDAPDVNLEPEANQSRLTSSERRAAVRIGGEDRHLLSIGVR